MTISKIDLKKTIKAYKAGKVAEVVDVPAMNFIMIDGKGDPNTSEVFTDAVEALYPVAYTLKFMVKKGALGIDYGVSVLEGLWWAEDMNDFLEGRKDRWLWTLMIAQPDFVTPEMYENAVTQVRNKKKPAAIDKLRFAKFKEGTCVQVLYTGPYSEEHDTILALHDYARSNGYELSGKHHEIYMNDMRRTAPEKLKTIIRQPVQKKSNTGNGRM